MSWQFVGIVTESEPITIDGANPWQYQWQSLDQPPISVPHPTYPHQQHQMWLYEIQLPDHKIKFAAGEFSNGVWGFYVPA